MTHPLVIEARSWLETPWHHNQSAKGIGVDCIRFIEAIALSQNFPVGDLPDRYSRQASEGKILDHLDRHAVKLPLDPFAVEEGDILVFKFSGIDHHLAIASRLPDGRTGIIHASAREGKVLEEGFDRVWVRVWCGRYRLPEKE